jgi:hypothetical protein
LTTPLGTATSVPFRFPCDTKAMSNGSHNFYCKAYDALGNSATSPSVAVTVNNGATATPGVVQWAIGNAGKCLRQKCPGYICQQ